MISTRAEKTLAGSLTRVHVGRAAARRIVLSCKTASRSGLSLMPDSGSKHAECLRLPGVRFSDVPQWPGLISPETPRQLTLISTDMPLTAANRGKTLERVLVPTIRRTVNL